MDCVKLKFTNRSPGGDVAWLRRCHLFLFLPLQTRFYPSGDTHRISRLVHVVVSESHLSFSLSAIALIYKPCQKCFAILRKMHSPRRAFVHDVNTTERGKRRASGRADEENKMYRKFVENDSPSRLLLDSLTLCHEAAYIYHLEVLRGFSSTVSNGLLLDDLLKGMCASATRRHARRADILG